MALLPSRAGRAGRPWRAASPSSCRSRPRTDGWAVPVPTPSNTSLRAPCADLIAPLIGLLYFAPEAHANYARLGFSPSPGERDGVALPDEVGERFDLGL